MGNPSLAWTFLLKENPKVQIKHIICLTLKYCWWKKSGKPVDRLFVPLFTRFYTSQVLQDFFINSLKLLHKPHFGYWPFGTNFCFWSSSKAKTKVTLPETNIAHENLVFPGKYHQHGGFSMAMLVYQRVDIFPIFFSVSSLGLPKWGTISTWHLLGFVFVGDFCTHGTGMSMVLSKWIVTYNPYISRL